MTPQLPAGAPGTKSSPLYFRMVTDDQGSVKVGRLLVAIGMTIGLAYLSVVIQRSGNSPDLARTTKMRGARMVKVYADARAEYWSSIAARAATAYHRATL